MNVDRTYRWEDETRRWLAGQHWLSTVPADHVIAFFRNAFEAAHSPSDAWFGTHPHTVSLVSGGIFLAALHNASEERGAWLLTDHPQAELPGLRLSPVRSTAAGGRPLTWAHVWPLDGLEQVVQDAALWKSVAAASQRILQFPIGRGREDLLQRRGKRRLSEFWIAGPGSSGIYPDDVDEDAVFFEGAVRRVHVNAYERDSNARSCCIAQHGLACAACGMNFERVYGPEGRGFIHVHHLRPLASIGERYQLDPIEDLRPVCPNCHAMIHRRKEPFSIEDVRNMLQRRDIHRG
jgi:hypothetical protein